MVRHLKVGAMTLLSLVAFHAAAARADYAPTISAAVTLEASGLYLFDYTLGAPASGELPVSQFYLQVASTATLSAITAPEGFDVGYAPGDTTISFLSDSASHDVTPGGFGSFTFLSTQAPLPGGFRIFGIDDAAGTIEGSAPGRSILAPVPEPASLALGVVGTLALAVGAARRRWRPSSAA